MEDFNALHEAFISALTESLRHTQIGVSQNVHVTHAQRPPAPRPIRITMNWIMPDGREYRQFVPLNGQSFWVESLPHFYNNEMPDRIEFSLGYADGGML
jgi:hypothetical protein